MNDNIKEDQSKGKFNYDSSKKMDDKKRTDKYGNLISKKNKSHKVTFTDQVDKNKKLADINIVTSYKQYNRIDEDGNLFILNIGDNGWSCSIY
jgi:hypothetical protein